MSERLTDEHMTLLERSLDAVENEYTPTCRSSSYGNGCAGATDESLDFWRRAADAVPAMLTELRTRRSHHVEMMRLANNLRDDYRRYGYCEPADVTALLDLIDRSGEEAEE